MDPWIELRINHPYLNALIVDHAGRSDSKLNLKANTRSIQK